MVDALVRSHKIFPVNQKLNKSGTVTKCLAISNMCGVRS